jgi:hypothetical protein
MSSLLSSKNLGRIFSEEYVSVCPYYILNVVSYYCYIGNIEYNHCTCTEGWVDFGHFLHLQQEYP